MSNATPTTRFSSFPRTKPPPVFISKIADVFKAHEASIATEALNKGLTSNVVLKTLACDLAKLGFTVELAKDAGNTIERPVFYGENGEPALRYEIDAYHEGWRCGLEVEAGRAILGNAVFRDLFQAVVMPDVDHLCLAVPHSYKYKSKEKNMVIKCYQKTLSIADALYGHTRVNMPYGLTVIGY